MGTREQENIFTTTEPHNNLLTSSDFNEIKEIEVNTDEYREYKYR